ncbi:MAG: hypothetical protein EBU90_01450 [Proteobacteria bacterium]|nr:hypothetical protein [Pseudomonadota bacterium]
MKLQILNVIDSLNESDFELLQVYQKHVTADDSVIKEEAEFIISTLSESAMIRKEAYQNLKE